MQKKMVGILASVAAAHAVLVIGVIAGGGCSSRQILGPHSYVDGPELSQKPAEAPAEQQQQPAVVPQVQPDPAVVPPPAVTPAAPVPVVKDDPVAPQARPAVRPNKGVTVYTVKSGDTLSMIAYKHGVRVSDLAACNNLSGKAMNRIRIGQKLTIPDGSSYTPAKAPKKSARKPAAKKNKKRTVKVSPLPADGIYVVKSGDSLDRIGRRYGVSAKAIAKENNIALTKILQIGDKLRIPGKAAASADKPVVATNPEKPAVTTDPAGTTLPGNTGDDLDPNMGLDTVNTVAPAAAPAGDPAAAPAADKPAATPAATPAAGSAAETESIEVPEDTTIEEYSKKIMVPVQDIRRLNPNLPADGKLKGGSYLVIPSMSL